MGSMASACGRSSREFWWPARGSGALVWRSCMLTLRQPRACVVLCDLAALADTRLIEALCRHKLRSTLTDAESRSASVLSRRPRGSAPPCARTALDAVELLAVLVALWGVQGRVLDAEPLAGLTDAVWHVDVVPARTRSHDERAARCACGLEAEASGTQCHEKRGWAVGAGGDHDARRCKISGMGRACCVLSTGGAAPGTYTTTVTKRVRST